MSYEHQTDSETQRRVATLIGSIDVPAPASLHGSVGALIAAGPQGRGRHRTWLPRPVLLAGAGASMCVAVLSLVLALSSSGPAQPTVLQASALGLRAATQSAPEENPSAPGQLAISADGISYPYWSRRFGWQTAGARNDEIGGRRVTTVFYTNTAAERIGYSIVAGSALATPDTGWTAVWHGVRFQVLHAAGATVVTWRRAGHTCILVGSGVSSKTLLTLANWQTT